MKICRPMVLGILLAGSAQASSWTDLWYRPDQQGQHALQAGDSKHAAELFADPRRRAYAELQSEQYAAAAQGLQPFTDAGSQYNRGNALAKSGDLQGALNAYDGTLKHADLESSLRRDAQHNRDLVARQLQTQKDQQRSSSGQKPSPKDQENGKPRGSESKDPAGSKSSNAPATAGSPQRSPGEDNKPNGSTPSGSPPMTPSSPSSPAQAKAGDDERRRPDGPPQPGEDQNASMPQASQQQATGLRKENPPGSVARSGTEEMDARRAARGDTVLPQTEQQLALEQWLRQIPDDPGGLLRRKFMIEHWMKQQQGQP